MLQAVRTFHHQKTNIICSTVDVKIQGSEIVVHIIEGLVIKSKNIEAVNVVVVVEVLNAEKLKVVNFRLVLVLFKITIQDVQERFFHIQIFEVANSVLEIKVKRSEIIIDNSAVTKKTNIVFEDLKVNFLEVGLMALQKLIPEPDLYSFSVENTSKIRVKMVLFRQQRVNNIIVVYFIAGVRVPLYDYFYIHHMIYNL